MKTIEQLLVSSPKFYFFSVSALNRFFHLIHYFIDSAKT